LKRVQIELRRRLDNRNILNENKKVKLNETSSFPSNPSKKSSALSSSISPSL
jgi:hypothetical protein